jgi:ABC-type multidrug transport system fused ATPase/permease subunit
MNIVHCSVLSHTLLLIITLLLLCCHKQIQGKRPPTGWPRYGGIDIQGLTVQYPSATTPVITDMTFSVRPKTRVGIVGRTGMNTAPPFVLR